MELPFLVVHGALVWKLAVVVLAALPLAIIRGLRALAARGQARSLANDALAHVEHLSQGTSDATLRGRLRDGALLSTVEGDATRDSMTGAPYLELPDGTRVALATAPTVVAGTADRGRQRALCAGDEVVLSGALARTGESTDYRTDAAVWRFTGAELTAIAVRPRASATPMSVISIVLLASLFGAIGYGIVWYLGNAAYQRTRHYERELLDRDIPAFGDFAIAAASPSRDRVLRTAANFDYLVAKRASNQPAHDELVALVAPCDVFHLRFRGLRWEAALETARECKNATHEAAALLYLGYYEAAATKHVLGRYEQEVTAIGAGRWQDAAVAVRSDRDSPIAECRANWYLRVGGFEAPVPQGQARMCAVYAALEGDVASRERLMRSLAEDDFGRDAKREYRLGSTALAMLARDGFNYFPGYTRSKDDIANWLALYAPLRSGEDGLATRESRAWIALMLGLPARSPHDPRSWRDDDFVAEVAMRAGGLRPPRGPGSDYNGVLLRRGVIPGRNLFVRCEHYSTATIALALAGDGRPLADALANCAPHGPIHTVRAVAPYIREGRAELADALRGQHDTAMDNLDWHMPFRLVEHLSLYRDAAALLGDHVEAARLQTILLRHAAVLMDRHKAVALVLLQQF